MRARVVALALLVAVAACDRDASDDDLAARLSARPPDGFTETGASGRATGPLGTDEAVLVSLTPPQATEKRLDDAGFDGGYARVWARSSGDYVVEAVLRMRDAAAATRLAADQTDAMLAYTGTAAFTLPSVPALRGYVYNAQEGGRSLFCQGAWFADGADAFHTYSCGPQPNAIVLVDELVRNAQARLSGDAPPG